MCHHRSLGSGTISATPELRAEELKPWLKREAADFLKPANEEAKRLIDKLRERLGDVREVCVKLENEANKQLEKGKAVRTWELRIRRFFFDGTGAVLRSCLSIMVEPAIN